MFNKYILKLLFRLEKILFTREKARLCVLFFLKIEFLFGNELFILKVFKLFKIKLFYSNCLKN
jgi:hypothetical protein